MTTPCRIFTKGEVLPFRQVSYNDIPRASPPATTATLSTAFTSRWSVGPKDKFQAGHNMVLFLTTTEWSHRLSTKNLRYLRHQRDKNISHADLADCADNSKNLCLSVSSVGQEYIRN